MPRANEANSNNAKSRVFSRPNPRSTTSETFKTIAATSSSSSSMVWPNLLRKGMASTGVWPSLSDKGKASTSRSKSASRPSSQQRTRQAPLKPPAEKISEESSEPPQTPHRLKASHNQHNQKNWCSPGFPGKKRTRKTPSFLGPTKPDNTRQTKC